MTSQPSIIMTKSKKRHPSDLKNRLKKYKIYFIYMTIAKRSLLLHIKLIRLRISLGIFKVNIKFAPNDISGFLG